MSWPRSAGKATMPISLLGRLADEQKEILCYQLVSPHFVKAWTKNERYCIRDRIYNSKQSSSSLKTRVAMENPIAVASHDNQTRSKSSSTEWPMS